MDDHFGDQGVEGGVRRIAGIAVGVGAHAGASGRLEHGQPSAPGPDGAVRADRLQIHTALDRMAARRGNVGLAQPEVGQACAVGHLQLGADQVEAQHFLGNRVLHLEAGIGLDEAEITAVLGDQEFEGAQPPVGARGRHAHGGLCDTAAHVGRQAGAGGDLH